MRDLSRRVAEAYVAQRDGMAFPWIPENGVEEDCSCKETETVESGARKFHTRPLGAVPFVFEIGHEELPVHDAVSVRVQMEEKTAEIIR